MYEDEVGKKNQFYKLSQIKKKMGTKSKNWKITGWWNWNIFQFEIVFF
jgi:hypothetical protein